MMRISPLCWVFGHSRRFDLRILVTGIDGKCRVSVFCCRCGAPMCDRLRRLRFEYPYHHPGRKADS